MADLFETKKFVFSVEGETEKWYLDWLQKTINSCSDAQYHALIKAKVEKSPIRFIKSLNAKSTPAVTHLCDVEGQTATDKKVFENTLEELKIARKQKGITYSLGYSNMSFELWFILHKQDCFGGYNNKREYLDLINSCYSEQFDTLSKYKKNENFNRCLSKLTISEVKDAINRAERIMDWNKNTGKQHKVKSGFSYYYENPALTIHSAVKMILMECGLY